MPTVNLIFNTCFIIRENGTQILLDQIQDAGEITIPRATIEENTKYQLIITAHNHFGASQSDPFILSVKDIGKLSFLFHSSTLILLMSVHLHKRTFVNDLKKKSE